MKITANQFALTFLIVVGTYITGVLIAYNVSDGIEKFEGDEKLAAVEAVRFIEDFYGGSIEIISAAGTYNYKVESVVEEVVPEEGRYSDCDKLFEVKIAKVGLFGVVGDYTGRTVCKSQNNFI